MIKKEIKFYKKIDFLFSVFILIIYFLFFLLSLPFELLVFTTMTAALPFLLEHEDLKNKVAKTKYRWSFSRLIFFFAKVYFDIFETRFPDFKAHAYQILSILLSIILSLMIGAGGFWILVGNPLGLFLFFIFSKFVQDGGQ